MKRSQPKIITMGFETIRNNTALKRCFVFGKIRIRFGTIRNNTALKRQER
ncbi:MAG: hypothetical protein ACLUCE_08375 [Streptococcus sp.]|nr:hypothetical protein [Streptococcus sp.]MBS7108046.1 hypothetical protein [Streptococcus sp.]